MDEGLWCFKQSYYFNGKVGEYYYFKYGEELKMTTLCILKMWFTVFLQDHKENFTLFVTCTNPQGTNIFWLNDDDNDSS